MSISIDRLIESYDVQNDLILHQHWKKIEQQLWQQIKSYDLDAHQYGTVLSQHLIRTSAIGMEFLKAVLGFSDKAAGNFYDANLLQDLGKIHPAYDVGIWSLPHRPTEKERLEKRLHTVRGNEMIDQALEGASDALKNHPHIQVIKAIQLYHHEKTDDRLGQVLKAICIIDAFDGDMIHRPHQPAKRTPEEALTRLQSAEKYHKAFDADILQRFIDFQMAAV